MSNHFYYYFFSALFATFNSITAKASPWTSNIKGYYGYLSQGMEEWKMMDGKLGFFLMEIVSPICLIATRISASYYGPKLPLEVQYQNDLMACLWILHYFNRSIIYTLRSSSRAPISIIVMLSACLFNILNATLNGYSLYYFNHNQPTGNIQYYLGVFVFVNSWFGNLVHDNILINLRRIGDNMKAKNHSEATIMKYYPHITKDDFYKNDQGKVYILPSQFLFKYVSSPHFFCENLEWLGFFIAKPSIASFLFCLNTFITLSDRAKLTNEWYKGKFNNYNAKYIIPFIY